MNIQPTHAELLQERRKRPFVGRRGERDAFLRNFQYGMPQSTIFWIHGPSGIGKSTLVHSFREIAAGQGALTALTNEAEATTVRDATILNAMARLAAQLVEAGAALEAFDRRYQIYLECMQQMEADPTAPHGAFARLARSGTRLDGGATQATAVRPVAEEVSKEVPAGDALDDRARAWGAYVAAKFQDDEKAALITDPVGVLTPLFVAGLNEIASRQPLVLCFDTWEWTSAYLRPWLGDLLESHRLSSSVWLVIAGRHAAGDAWEPYLPLMTSFELYEFTDGEARHYLRLQGITDEAHVQQILGFSGRVPLLVSTLASALGRSAGARRDGARTETNAADDLVDRYLRWVDDASDGDEARRDAALRCSAARRIDRDVVAALVGEESAAELFGWLIDLPFIQSRPGYWEYHPTIRALILDYARRRSLRDARADHATLEAHYGDLAHSAGDEPRYLDPSWREYWVEAFYHSLMSERRGAVRDGLEAFMLSLRHSYDLAGDLAQAWVQARDDTGTANVLGDWGRILVTAWLAFKDRNWDALLAFYHAAHSIRDLSPVSMSGVCHVGGLAFAGLQRYEHAMEAFREAIEQDPEHPTAYYDRGCTLDDLGQTKRAIQDFDRAIELNPDDAAAYVRRGTCHADLQDYRRAIEDFDRTIELWPDGTAAHFGRGIAYAGLEEYERAIQDLSRAIELSPGFVGAHYNRGIAHDRLEEYERAIEDYSQAIELQPDLAQAYNNRGSAYALMANDEQAIEDYSRAIELDPGYAMAYFNRGLAYARLEELALAVEDYDRSIELNPKHAVAYRARGLAHAQAHNDERAVQDLDRAIDLGLGGVTTYGARGNAHARLGNYERAAEDASQVIALEPEDAAAYDSRGRAYAALHHYDRAIHDYDRAIEISPGHAGAYSNRGLAYAGQEDYQRAIQDCDRALEIDPEYAAAHNNRGLAYDALEEYERAIEDYGRAIELNEGFAQAHHNRGLAYAVQQDYHRAVQDYGRAIELRPGEALTYYHRAVAYDALQDYEWAVQDYDRAIDLDPGHAAAYYNRGTARAHLDQYRQAIEDYDKSIELNPGYAAAYNNRGLAYTEVHEYLRAIESYDRAIDLNPSYAPTYNNRGLAYASLQDFLWAIEDYDRALERDPTYALAHYNRACAHAFLGNPDTACDELASAIRMDPSYRAMAKGDTDFDGIRHVERFQALVERP